MNGWHKEIVATVWLVLSQMNSCVEMYLRAGEFKRNQEVLSVRLETHQAPGVDLRTHNYPTCNEVAAILLDKMGADETRCCTSEVGIGVN
jgi:hypothetical protein